MAFFDPVLAADYLGVSFEQPEELGLSEISKGFEVAGLLERPAKRIHVAQKFLAPQRLWTGSHEIGHWICHNEMTHHHDRPLEGTEVYRAEPLERQANLFASVFLMSERLVKTEFELRFGSWDRGLVVDDSIAYWLRAPGENLSANDFARKGRHFRSVRVACTTFFQRGEMVKSLCERFRVSPTAMAIRLEKLELVR